MTNAPPSDPRRLLRDVTDTLRRLRDLAQRLGDEPLAVQLEDSLERIESQRFTIAVAGEFKRGKSTFVNALLGADVLPSDVAPASAALTRVTYGQPARARIVYRAEDDQPPHEEMIALEQLKDYITKLTPEAGAIAATVNEAVVSYPSPFCRIHRVDLLDTPGLGDEAAMTSVTATALQHVDGVIMMVMADAPFGDSEGTFLEQLLAQGFNRVLFVVTALDRLEEDDRTTVLEFVTRRVQERVSRYAKDAYGEGSVEYTSLLHRFGMPRIFGISGRQALQARQSNDAKLEAESGFKAFLDALDYFLTRESESLALERRIAQIHSASSSLTLFVEQQIAVEQQIQSSLPRVDPIITALLQALYALGNTELQRIADAHDQARTMIAAQQGNLNSALKHRLNQEISTFPFTGDELDTRYASVVDRLTAQLTNTAREVLAEVMAQVHLQFSQIYEPLLQAQRPFAITLAYVLNFTRQYAGTNGNQIPLPARLQQLEQNTYDEPTMRTMRETDLLRLGREIPLSWIDHALQASVVRECLVVPSQENSFRRGLRRMELPGRFKQALLTALFQSIDQWLAEGLLNGRVTRVTGDLFASLRQEIGQTLGFVQEQQRAREREQERRMVRSQHELKELTRLHLELGQLVARSKMLRTHIEAYMSIASTSSA